MILVRIMNKQDLWLLFKETGKIEYYLKYNELKEKEAVDKNDKKSKRNYC